MPWTNCFMESHITFKMMIWKLMISLEQIDKKMLSKGKLWVKMSLEKVVASL